MIMEILQICMKRGCKVWTIKDNYRLGDDISSKVLAFAFGLSAEIERNLISQRTKEALARIRSEGRSLGRPFGSRNSHVKLSGMEDDIRDMLDSGMSKLAVARELGVHVMTLYGFLRARMGGYGIGEFATPPEGCDEEIVEMLRSGMEPKDIARHFGVHWSTMTRHIVKTMRINPAAFSGRATVKEETHA